MLAIGHTKRVLTVVASLLIVTSVIAAELYAPQAITKDERCPVCGMYPASYPKWHSQIVFKDGKHSSFDSQMDMFRFLHNMARYDKSHGEGDIGKIYVIDYETGNWLDARQAFFVAGSRVSGPMGVDLPAFSSKEQASGFIKQSAGEILTFQQVTPAALAGEHSH